MKLKLHGPSFTGAPSTALRGNHCYLAAWSYIWVNLKVIYLFLFLSLNSNFKPHKTQTHCCAGCSGRGGDGVFCVSSTHSGREGLWQVEGLAGWLQPWRPSTPPGWLCPLTLVQTSARCLSFPGTFLSIPQPPDTVCLVPKQCLCLRFSDLRLLGAEWWEAAGVASLGVWVRTAGADQMLQKSKWTVETAKASTLADLWESTLPPSWTGHWGKGRGLWVGVEGSCSCGYGRGVGLWWEEVKKTSQNSHAKR